MDTNKEDNKAAFEIDDEFSKHSKAIRRVFLDIAINANALGSICGFDKFAFNQASIARMVCVPNKSVVVNTTLMDGSKFEMKMKITPKPVRKKKPLEIIKEAYSLM